MKYKMNVDLWIRLLLYGVVLSYLPLMVTVDSSEYYIFILSTLLTAAIILPLFMAYYELTEEELVIHIYFFKKRIPYDRIKSLRLCQNWTSGSAMSRFRIEIIEHNKSKIFGTTYISPVNREECYEELLRLSRNLEGPNPFDLSDY
jgi:hypothetical protein